MTNRDTTVLLRTFLLSILYISGTTTNVTSGNATKGETPQPVFRTAVRQDRLWQLSSHPISNVTVDHAPVGKLLSPLLDYPFLLPRVQLKAGVAYAGARVRLRRFVRDLLSGHRALKIGVVGGSISWGQGASVIGVTDWFSLLARWMIDTFPAANITARNGAVPATPSSYMVMCMEMSVDPDVDLVLVEYGMNDGYEDNIVNNGVVKPMERLLRRLLALPGRPAVVIMQVPMYGIAMDPEDPQHQGFFFTSEDVDASLSHYYDVPYLSLRTALYRLAAFERQEGWRWNQTFSDFHPGDAGFHCMADLVVHLLQSTALQMLLTDPWGAEDGEALLRPLPPPMYNGNTPPDSTMCVVGESFRPLVTSAQGFVFTNEGTQGKPKWGFVANWTDPRDARGRADDGASGEGAAEGKKEAGGEGDVTGDDDGSGGSGSNDSDGEVAAPRLVLRLDTRRGASLLAPYDTVPVYVLYLKSYVNMGRAEISCVSGCSCSSLQVDAHIKERVSQTYLARVNVTQSPACDIAVTLLQETGSGSRKFKVSGVVVSETGGDTTVLERMTDGTGWFMVGRFHTGDLPMAVYGKAPGPHGSPPPESYGKVP